MKIKYLENFVGDKVQYAHEGDAGFDLRAAISKPVQIPPGGRVAVPAGIQVELDAGNEMQIRSRSGNTIKKGLVVMNAPGTIDETYRGEIGVILYNATIQEKFVPTGKNEEGQTTGHTKCEGNFITINPGDKIAQAVVAPYVRVQFEETEVLSETIRGEGGFGSTDETPKGPTIQ